MKKIVPVCFCLNASQTTKNIVVTIAVNSKFRYALIELIRCKYNSLLYILMSAWIFTIAGCNNLSKPACNKHSEILAIYSNNITIDGKLDEPVWSNAPKYGLCLAGAGLTPSEHGQIQVAWNENYFYLAAVFEDSDIVAEGTENGLHHYRLGDVCELFLKPADSNCYWEIYGTPSSKKTAFWCPGQGRLGLPSCFSDRSENIKVAAAVNGTLNNWQDKDICWSLEIAVPINELSVRDRQFAPDVKLEILIGRYNYSEYLNLQGPELSMYPRLSQPNFQKLCEYADLILVAGN